MTQYLMAVHGPEEQYDTPLEDMQASFEAVGKFNEKIMASGQWVFGGGLERPSSASVVDNTTGKNVVTDGPYLEGKEHIGGFWVIKAADLDEALRWASEGSAACQAPVEVRPFQDDAEVEAQVYGGEAG